LSIKVAIYLNFLTVYQYYGSISIIGVP